MVLGPHTITRLRATETTSSHSPNFPTRSWDAPARLVISGCSVQPVQGAELANGDRDGLTTRYTVWAPVDADVKPTDRVTYAGDEYEVSGGIQRWDFGSLAHVVINIERTEG